MDLRTVTWRGVQVLNRLYGALRDEMWTTITGSQLDLSVEEDADGFLVRFTCDHQPAGMSFVWSGTIEGTSDGLTATFDGEAHGKLVANRIGWCLLHPLSQVGGQAQFTLAQRTHELPLPFHVVPQVLGDDGGVQPAWGPFDTLMIDAAGVRTHISFEGELFETEDQRNWTDASFKTYSTPLSEPRPRALDAGDHVRQVVNFSFSTGQTAPVPKETPPAQQTRTRRTAVMNDTALPVRDVEAVLTAVDGLRAEVSADNPAEVSAATDIVALARRAPVWELSILASDATAWDALDQLVADGSAPTVVLVLPRDTRSGDRDECTTAALVARARGGLPSVNPAMIGGGTRHNFCELQRHDMAHLPVVSCTFSPRVHADDERSIRETPSTYLAVVASAKHAAPHAAFLVGPLRDPDGLPAGWVADSARSWEDAGVDAICIVDVPTLVRGGRLTDIGESVKSLHSAALIASARMDPP